MRDRKKRNIIIGALCCLLVFMGIGYAILSQTLNISGIANMKGNWNVRITNMELLSENKTGRAEEVSHSFTDTTATFTADLYMPGDSIEYRVTVENQGNIDALLKSITPTTTNKSEGIKFSHSEIDNTVLTAGKTITFTMKVEFLEGATSIPNVENVKYNLELVYVQYNGGEYTPAVETTEESCFWITDDGTLLSYDSDCGTDVVVPATINNIPVKRTGSYFGASNGIVVAMKSSDQSPVYIFMNQSKQDKFFEQMRQNGSTDDEIAELRASSYIKGDTELESINLMTEKEFAKSNGGSKVYRDSTGTIKLESSATDAEANVFDFMYDSYCTTEEVCELLKEYYRSKDPAVAYGITDSSYYEYIEGRITFQLLDNIDYVLNITALPSESVSTIDFSQAIYMETLMHCFVMGQDGDIAPLKKIVLPPNVEIYGHYSAMADETTFPSNSIAKIIGFASLSGVKGKLPSTLKVIAGDINYSGNSVTIPASVVRLGPGAFQGAGLTSLTFENGSNLIAMYGDNSNYLGTFKGNNLTTLVIPKSVEYIGYTAFSNNNLTSVRTEANSNLKYLDSTAFQENPNLTQITLTSPTDLDGWPNGRTVHDITVTYER